MGHWMSFGLYLSFFRMPHQVHLRPRRIDGQHCDKGYHYRCAARSVQRFRYCGTRIGKQRLGSIVPFQSVCLELGTMDERTVAPLTQHLAEQTDSYPCAVLLRTHQAGGSTEDSRSGNSAYPLAELQNGVWWYCVRCLYRTDTCYNIPPMEEKEITFLFMKSFF